MDRGRVADAIQPLEWAAVRALQASNPDNLG